MIDPRARAAIAAVFGLYKWRDGTAYRKKRGADAYVAWVAQLAECDGADAAIDEVIPDMHHQARALEQVRTELRAALAEYRLRPVRLDEVVRGIARGDDLGDLTTKPEIVAYLAGRDDDEAAAAIDRLCKTAGMYDAFRGSSRLLRHAIDRGNTGDTWWFQTLAEGRGLGFDVLEAQLHSSDARVRSAAANMLLRYGQPARLAGKPPGAVSIETLCETISAASKSSADADATAALRATLDSEVAGAALDEQALCTVAAAGAASAVARLLADFTPTKPSATAILSALAALAATKVAVDRAAITKAIDGCLRHGDGAVVAGALAVAVELAEPSLVPAILEAADAERWDEHQRERLRALQATPAVSLGALEDAAVVSDPELRRRAAHALGRLVIPYRPATTYRLVRLAEDAEVPVRLAAVRSIGDYNPDIISVLIAAATADPVDEIRAAAREKLRPVERHPRVRAALDGE